MENQPTQNKLDLLIIGKKIKSLREEKEWKIKDLAKRSGLSNSLISQVENGHTQASLETLWKLSGALEVSIGDFFDKTDGEGFAIVRKENRKELYMPQSNLRYQLLSPNLKGKIEMLLVVLEPEQIKEKMTLSHEGEECGYVISGELIIVLGGEKYHLREGDSIYYNTAIPHRFYNPGTETSVSVWAMTPPSF